MIWRGEAREVIEANRKKHEEENEQDKKLVESMENAEAKRLDLNRVKEMYKRAMEASLEV